jgi:hypothetical protein
MSEPAPESEPNQPAPETEKPSWEDTFKGEDPAKVRKQLDHAREWEKRAKENSTKASQLDTLVEASKSAEERLNERASKAETERDDARAEAARLRIAVQHGISLEDADLFLTGKDEETLTAQAKRLTDRDAERKKQGNHVPREGATPPATENTELAFARELFSPG